MFSLLQLEDFMRIVSEYTFETPIIVFCFPTHSSLKLKRSNQKSMLFFVFSFIPLPAFTAWKEYTLLFEKWNILFTSLALLFFSCLHPWSPSSIPSMCKREQCLSKRKSFWVFIIQLHPALDFLLIGKFSRYLFAVHFFHSFVATIFKYFLSRFVINFSPFFYFFLAKCCLPLWNNTHLYSFFPKGETCKIY